MNPVTFLNHLLDAGVRKITGVPDSLLKELCLEISARDEINHFLAPSEGVAVANAVGSYLATGLVPAVYMQNSGIGNAINPLLSLVDKEVSGVPLVLLIGWRGHPGVKDEPQHSKQGAIQEELLDALGIPYRILHRKTSDCGRQDIKWAFSLAEKSTGPVALMFREGAFESTQKSAIIDYGSKSRLARSEAIRVVVDNSSLGSKFISSTGKISRELYAYREQRRESNGDDFYVVGAMGHASAIAFGFANELAQTQGKVICLDGDGAFLMHLGSAAHIGNSEVRNFIHIVLNNGAHESVGGQPTIAHDLSLTECARAFGYKFVGGPITTRHDLEQCVTFLSERGAPSPAFLEIAVTLGSAENLPRPEESPFDNARAFMSGANPK